MKKGPRRGSKTEALEVGGRPFRLQLAATEGPESLWKASKFALQDPSDPPPPRLLRLGAWTAGEAQGAQQRGFGIVDSTARGPDILSWEALPAASIFCQAGGLPQEARAPMYMASGALASLRFGARGFGNFLDFPALLIIALE